MIEEINATQEKVLKPVPISWEALEDAFENNAHEVHSYLHLETGEVIRVVDGIADPSMHYRIMSDPTYLRIDPVSSREQYRWMERFINTVEEEGEFKDKLLYSIDGKGAFRRFKDVLMLYPVERERWFVFRSERLKTCMESWLESHGVQPVERPQWHAPTEEEDIENDTDENEMLIRKQKAVIADTARKKLHQLVDVLPIRELDTAYMFLEFLRERRHLSAPQWKVDEDAHDARQDIQLEAEKLRAEQAETI